MFSRFELRSCSGVCTIHVFPSVIDRTTGCPTISVKNNTPLLLHRIDPEGNGLDIDESDESYSSESSSEGDDYSDESEHNPDGDERTP